MVMDKKRIREICTERLDSWTNHLVSEHATPAMLIGVGHDHKSGRLVVCTTEDMPDESLALLVHGALKKLAGLP